MAFDHLAAEYFEIRFEEPDVATPYAEMGNLLSLDPKIHSLRADAKKLRRFGGRVIDCCSQLAVRAHKDRMAVDRRAKPA